MQHIKKLKNCNLNTKKYDANNILLFGVAGNPILHSLSPNIHNAAFNSLGINAIYLKFLGENFNQILEMAREMEVKALNVTSPFKQDAWNVAKEHDKFSNTLHATNLLIWKNNHWQGYNTDVVGIEKTFVNNNINLSGKNLLLIGTGGAAKAVAYILTKGKANVTIINRTETKALKLAKQFSCNYAKLTQKTLEKLLSKSDIVVSCISTNNLLISKSSLNTNQIIFQADYVTDTALLKIARIKKCKILDGKEWLLYQGLESFKLFSKIKHTLQPKDILQSMKKAVFQNKNGNINKKKNDNICLIGMMGCGKSTVAKQLSKLLKRKFVDIDLEIQKRSKQSISNIFLKKGETYFRKLESKIIKETLNKKNQVIATGGGIVLLEKNISEMKKQSTVIWLWAKNEEILLRINDEKNRPLLQEFNQELNNDPNHKQKLNRQKLNKISNLILEEKIRMIEKNRRSLYVHTADLVINTTNIKPTKIARMIANEIHKTL